MTKELTILQPENKRNTPWWKQLLPQTILCLLQERFQSLPPNEIHLSNEELSERVQTLYAMVRENGEIIIPLGKGRFCRVSVHPKRNDRLEFRIGGRESVKQDRFSEMMELETVIQVTFGVSGEIHEAVQADLEKQSDSLMGSGEYNAFGTLYGDMKYMPYVDAVGIFTGSGAQEISVPAGVHDTMLQKIFEPLQVIIWKLTEGKPSQKFQRVIAEIIPPSPRSL